MTLSITLAVSWQVSGIWSLLLPFTSLALLRAADWLDERWQRRSVLVAVVALGILPVAVHETRLVQGGMTNFETGHRREERRIGLELRAALKREGGLMLIDSHNNLDYLDVITGSAAPDRFVTSADADPVAIANFVPMRAMFLREGNQEVIERYLTDRFDLAHGGDARV